MPTPTLAPATIAAIAETSGRDSILDRGRHRRGPVKAKGGTTLQLAVPGCWGPTMRLTLTLPPGLVDGEVLRVQLGHLGLPELHLQVLVDR